jgi:hypothetical protein
MLVALGAGVASALVANPPSRSGNSRTANTITKGERRLIIDTLENQMGLTRSEFRVHCGAVLTPPANTGQSGYYRSLKTTCYVSQYVTAP